MNPASCPPTGIENGGRVTVFTTTSCARSGRAGRVINKVMKQNQKERRVMERISL
ncbi:hypothetical protein GCM10007921_28590 [Tritonibacter mobilis]|nr:hypothetical protein GCM10007921_28590 [Tritonibacter mobilis]